MPPKGTTGIKCGANGRRGNKAERNSGNRDAGHKTPRGRRTLSEEKERTRSVNNKKGIAPQVNDQKPHIDERRIDANIWAGNTIALKKKKDQICIRLRFRLVWPPLPFPNGRNHGNHPLRIASL